MAHKGQYDLFADIESGGQSVKDIRKEHFARPKTRKKMAGPRSSPVLKSSVYASKKKAVTKTVAKKKSAAQKKVDAKKRRATGPKSNPKVRSAAYYARKRYAADLKKKKK